MNQSRKIPEILAPAGGRAQFFAALNSGADAVYLGLDRFNARARASNFSIQELRGLIPIADQFGMKVLLTMNVLIKDVELSEICELLCDIETLGLYALIVQDLGLFRLIRDEFPSLRVHASTQLAVHNLAGVQQVADWGFKRVVLAREISAAELKKIRSAIPRDVIEIEAFCHGSLCYSYSGLCFFSGANDARSGNRGECAYTCRQPYKVVSEAGHGFLFSMRDLDTSNDIEKFVYSGVDTLKIEGRKKDAQYVASSIQLYRATLDAHFGHVTLRESAPHAARNLYIGNAYQSIDQMERIRLKQKFSFQRRPTTFFLSGRYRENVIDLDNPGHMGISLGRIEHIGFENGATFIRVRLGNDLSRFDGVKIVDSKERYHSKPQHGAVISAAEEKFEALRNRFEGKDTQFSVRSFRVAGTKRRLHDAPLGQLVDIDLPNEICQLQLSVGDYLFKCRSDALRQEIEGLVNTPKSTGRVRPLLKLPSLKLSLHAAINNQTEMRVEYRFSEFNEIHDLQFYVESKTLCQNLEGFCRKIKTDFSLVGPLGEEADDRVISCDDVQFSNVDGLYLSPSDTKDLRRRLRSSILKCEIESKRAKIQTLKNNYSVPAGRDVDLNSAGNYFSFKIDRLAYLPWIAESLWKECKEIVFEPKRNQIDLLNGSRSCISRLKEFCDQYGMNLRIAVPPVVRAWDEVLLQNFFREARANGVTCFEIANPASMHQLKNWTCIESLESLDLSSDFTFYMLNRIAVQFAAEMGLRKITLSIEDDKEDLDSLLRNWMLPTVEAQAVLFKDTPLFIAEACSLTALHDGCPSGEVCGYRTLEIENQRGERFFVAHEGCKSIVYAKQAYALSQHQVTLQALGIRNFRLDFLTRPYERLGFQQIMADVRQNKQISETHSANFERSLL